jgi:hypothetical protein
MKNSSVGYIFVAYSKMEGYWHATDIAETKQGAIQQWEYDVCSEDWFEGYFIEVDSTPIGEKNPPCPDIEDFLVIKAK